MSAIAHEFHFVFGLRPQQEAFHLVHWLCLESCRRVNAPRAIHLHCRHRPHGAWWERLAPHLEVHDVGSAPVAGFASERYGESAEGRFIEGAGLDYAHEADFLRLVILESSGGVYADMDTLFVERYPPHWFEAECLIGEESPVAGADGVLRPSLCNAVILAQPHAPFIRRWRDEAEGSFDGTWSRHSCQAAARLWAQHPLDVGVLPRVAFYRYSDSRAGIAALFEHDDDDQRGVYSIHLWAHLWWSPLRRDFTSFHGGMITPRWVREAESTYARLSRPLLPDDAR